MDNNIEKFTIAFPFKYAKAKFNIKRISEWGVIDYIFLKELSFKIHSLQQLCDYSNLEKQIVIQILLPLMKMGWIELINYNSEFYFQITESGKKVCLENKLPHKGESYNRNRDFLVDFKNNYYGIQKFKLLPESKARITELSKKEKNFFQLNLIIEDIYPNYELMCNAIAYENEIINDILDNFHYGISDVKFILFDVHYDYNSNNVIFHDENLINIFPEEIRNTINLLPYQKSKKRRKTQKITEFNQINFSTDHFFEFESKSLEMILGAKSNHLKVLDLIKEAEEYLIIHSTFIGDWSIFKSGTNEYTDLFQELRNALKRNIGVYILWGKDEAEEDHPDYLKTKEEIEKIEAALNQFNQNCLKDNIFNTINFNNFKKTGSHTKFILTKSKEQNRLLFSSCNFLYTNFLRFESSLLITDNSFVKNFMYIAADISSGKDLHSDTVRNDLLRYAKSIPKTPESTLPKIKVNLVLKYQHYQYIDLAKSSCKHRLYIVSDKLNAVSFRPIADALKNSNFKKYAYFSQRSKNFTPFMERNLIKSFAASPININLRLHDPKTTIDGEKNPKKNHSKVLAWDNNHILITSLNWLSCNASPPPNATDIYHEIGIYVERRNIAKEFIEVFKAL